MSVVESICSWCVEFGAVWFISGLVSDRDVAMSIGALHWVAGLIALGVGYATGMVIFV